MGGKLESNPVSRQGRGSGAGTVARVLLAPAIWVEQARWPARVALLVVYLLLIVLPGIWIYRASRLAGLPDVGDPFDVSAYRQPVPDAENAFAFYQRALRQVRPPEGMLPRSLPDRWSDADEAVRAWSTENHEAMMVWCQGTAAPRVPYTGSGPARLASILSTNMPGLPSSVTWANGLAQLVVLEGSRREEAGDLAEALRWYEALLRFSRHIETHAPSYARGSGTLLHRKARHALERWAAEPGVDEAWLQATLDQVVAIEDLTPPLSDSLKADYLNAFEQLDRVDAPYLERGNFGSQLHDYLDPVLQARWFVNNDRERGRRILRLLHANWLPHCDKPWEERPLFVTELRLYDDSEAPPSSRTLPPVELERLVHDAPFLESLVPSWPIVEGMLAAERTEQAALILGLAEQAHLRQFGTVPVDPASLVGRSLERLPEGYDPTRLRPGPWPAFHADNLLARPLWPDPNASGDSAPPRAELSSH